jgi:mono/diheme cytochrome c family protein
MDPEDSSMSRTLSRAVILAAALAAASARSDDKPYTVVDGYKVDSKTMDGFRTWRAAACDRCHGANQEGMVGPSLIESLKVLSKDDFKKTLAEGRLEKGMPSWKENKQVMENIDKLYAYLKGRSDGAIKRAKVEEIK